MRAINNAGLTEVTFQHHVGADGEGTKIAGPFNLVTKFFKAIRNLVGSLSEKDVQPIIKYRIVEISKHDRDLTDLHSSLISAWEDVDSSISSQSADFTQNYEKLKRLRTEYAREFPDNELIFETDTGGKIVLVPLHYNQNPIQKQEK